MGGNNDTAIMIHNNDTAIIDIINVYYLFASDAFFGYVSIVQFKQYQLIDFRMESLAHHEDVLPYANSRDVFYLVFLILFHCSQ